MVEEYILKDGYLYTKIKEIHDFQKLISFFKEIKLQLKKNQCKKVLINTVGCILGWNISEIDRYHIGEELVNLFHSPDYIKVAFVIEEKNYTGFAELVATNRGAMVKMFFDEEDAINWLKGNVLKEVPL